MFRKQILMIILLFSCVSLSSAVKLATERIGYVDIDKIVNEILDKQVQEKMKKNKKSLKQLLEKKEEEVTNKIEIKQKEYEIVNSSISALQVMWDELNKENSVNITSAELISSTDTKTSDNAMQKNKNIEDKIEAIKIDLEKQSIIKIDLEKDLSILKKEYLNYKKEMEDRFSTITDDHEYNLLGNIYDIIHELARVGGFTIIVNNASMLYGNKVSDLTEKVMKRVKKLNKKLQNTNSK